MAMSDHACLKPSVLKTMGSSRKLSFNQLNKFVFTPRNSKAATYCSVRELCSIELTCVVPNMAL